MDPAQFIRQGYHDFFGPGFSYRLFIEFIHARGSVKSGDLVQLYGISRQAAGKELGRMTELGLIPAEEKGRATRYVMA